MGDVLVRKGDVVVGKALCNALVGEDVQVLLSGEPPRRTARFERMIDLLDQIDGNQEAVMLGRMLIDELIQVDARLQTVAAALDRLEVQ